MRDIIFNNTFNDEVNIARRMTDQNHVTVASGKKTSKLEVAYYLKMVIHVDTAMLSVLVFFKSSTDDTRQLLSAL